jgi:hypothetical protein
VDHFSVLLTLLVVAAYVGYVGWNLTDVATMTLGIIFSIIVGVGLMGLMFYSSRHVDTIQPPGRVSK